MGGWGGGGGIGGWDRGGKVGIILRWCLMTVRKTFCNRAGAASGPRAKKTPNWDQMEGMVVRVEVSQGGEEIVTWLMNGSGV